MSDDNNTILIKNSRILNELKTSLYFEYSKERTGVHVSDVIYCPRESVFRKLTPIAVTDKELNFFTSGAAIHTSIQTLAKYFDKYEIEKEIIFEPGKHEYTKDLLCEENEDEELKILAHVDLWDKERNIPIEAKSTRKARLGIYNRATKTYSEEKPKSFNVTQLKIYMSLLGADTGYLLYQLLMNFDSYPFELFEVTMTEDERKTMLRWLTKECLRVVNAVNKKNAILARHVADDKELNWKCDSCKWLNECIEMRNIEYMTNREVK